MARISMDLPFEFVWILTCHLRVLSHQTQPSWRRTFLCISPLPPTQVFISCESVALFCEMTHECIIKQEEEFALQQTPKSLLLFKTWSAKSWPMKRMVYPRLVDFTNLANSWKVWPSYQLSQYKDYSTQYLYHEKSVMVLKIQYEFVESVPKLY